MMISPEDYKKNNESNSIEELVLQRERLYSEIATYEKKHIINKESYEYDEIAKPSAKDIYNMDNLYLKEITDLIIERNKKSYLKKPSGLSDVDRELMKKYNIDPSIDNVKDLLKAVELKKEEMLKSEQDEKLKLQNGKYAEDQETKKAFEGYMSKIDKYNEQVIGGEKPDVKMGDLLNEYTDTFYDEALEEKLKETEEDFNDREKDTKIDDLIDKIDEKLNIHSESQSVDEQINAIDERIANIEIQENDSMQLVPNSLKEFISFDEDGYVFAKQKLPIELENDYNNFIHNYYDAEDNKVVNTIVNKIIELSFNTETTIAQLINYKPEIAFVSPLTQGIIRNAVLKKCVTKGIKLEENSDEIGGLAYFVKFKKNL